MTDFTSVSIRPPKDWQAFERHSRLLYEYSLGDPGTQNNGRSGQRQHGVDIFGRRGGGNGPLVGIQCKGKDRDYGGVVTEDELRREVKKTQKFKPSLKEFILITTAPNDAVIQEKARLLETEVRAAGRDLSISVWGWERVQQEINRFREVLKAFHPDATPFTDLQLDAAAQTRQDSAQIKEILAAQGASSKAFEERLFKLVESRLPPTQISSVDPPIARDPVDKVLNDQIDALRDLIRAQRPKTALSLLTNLKEKSWSTASDKTRFRVLGNLGAAHYSLGEYDKAADYFLEAYPYNPGQPISYANKIAGLLIKGRDAEARELAKEALSKFPDSGDLALQRLQAREEGEDVEQLWSGLPSPIKDKPEITFYRIGALRASGNPLWRRLAEVAASASPEDERLKVMRAEAVLDRIFSVDRSALGSATGDVPDEAEIQNTATTLDAVWQQSLKRETPPNIGAAHNGALAYNILGRKDDARRLLDEVLNLPDPPEETKRLRLALYPRNGPLGDAVKLADTLENTAQSAVIRAELRVHESPSAARALLEQRDTFPNHIDAMGASFVVVDSYLEEGNFEAALAEAERLKARFPDDPQSFLTIYRVRKAAAEPDAQSYLETATTKLTADSDFVSRFMVADELTQTHRWDDVIKVLRPYVSTRFDSLSLRALVGAAANGDRREILKSVLDELPPEVAKRSFYRRSRIALAIRVQDIKAAESEIRKYLAEHPRSLEMHLQLMHALFRQDKLSELRAEVAKPASAFDGEPIDFVKLAQFKDSFGDWREAHALAYEKLVKHFSDAEVNMAYVAAFLQPGHSTGLDINPAAVGEDMAVTLTTESGAPELFIIEPDPALRPTAEYVPPTHPIAKALLGRTLREKILLPDKTEATIDGIKPKVLHALHEVLENFQRQFPETEGLERVKVDTRHPGGLGEIVQRLRQRHEAIEDVFRTYESGLFPIACVARILGQRTVETFLALSASGRNIRVCEGTQQERDAALAAIRGSQRKGCVLDSIALHIVRRLELDRAVAAVCGPISTVENRMLRLTQEIYELEQNLDQPDMSLSWSDGKTYRHEITQEQKREALNVVRADRDWMRSSVEILPAQGAGDLPAELSEFVARFGSGLLDEARAAQGSGRLFICEDQALRVLVGSTFKIPATWLQPVLMVAKDEGHLSAEEYRKAIVALIDTRLEFISVDLNLLTGALGSTTSLDLPPEFLKAASRIGGAKADLASHIKVAAGAITQFWNNDGLPWVLRQAAVGKLLENLCRERTLDQVRLIIGAFVRFNDQVLDDARFLDYLSGWVRGHFIPMK